MGHSVFVVGRLLLWSFVQLIGVAVVAADGSSTITIDVVATEREMLLRFYDGSNGLEWTRNQFWGDETVSHCFWFGIVCDDDSNVIRIDLSNNNVAGRVDPILYFLPHLSVLDLRDNKIRDAGWEVFLNESTMYNNDLAPLLQVMNFARNSLRGSLPSFENARFLHTLILDDNALTGSISERFLLNNTNTIITISLLDNNLTGALPESLLRFPLLNLSVGGNQIESVPVSFCEQAEWNSGAVKRFACDAILCPPGTFSQEFGRQVSVDSACMPCETMDHTFFGARDCSKGNKNNNKNRRMMKRRRRRWRKGKRRRNPMMGNP